MPRHFLIDGYNLAYAWQPVRQKLLSDKEAGRVRLLDLLLRYKKISGAGITVVFDGRSMAPAPSGEPRPGLEVIFASGSGSADEEIYRRISSSKSRGSLTVVSSDRQVAGFAKRHGAQAMGSGEFSTLVDRSLKKGEKGGEKPESVDVAEWLEFFGRDGQG